jgi:hypothetical protein
MLLTFPLKFRKAQEDILVLKKETGKCRMLQKLIFGIHSFIITVTLISGLGKYKEALMGVNVAVMAETIHAHRFLLEKHS